MFDQPQEVINRWARIKAIKTIKPYVDYIFIWKLRITLLLKERRKAKVLKATFNTILIEYRKLEQTQFESLKTLFNISLFFLLAERDLQAIKIDALSHPDPWKRNLSLRIMLLIIHERDISKVASANIMNTVYSQSKISDEIKNQMIESLRRVNKVQKKVNKLLATTRNFTIAHRDSNSMQQYKEIEKVTVDQVMGITEEYFEASNVFASVMPKILSNASNVYSLLNQYGKKGPNPRLYADARKPAARR